MIDKILNLIFFNKDEIVMYKNLNDLTEKIKNILMTKIKKKDCKKRT